VTPAELIYHRRVQVLDRAGQTSVTEACPTFGVSRTTEDRWAGRAQRSGLAALLPKAAGHRCCRPPPHPTRSRWCWPRRWPAPPSAPSAWSSTWPSVGCADRPLGCRSSRAGTGSAVGPSGWPPWPSCPRRPRHRDHTSQGRARRVLPLRRPAWRLGRPGHLLCRQARGRRAGLAADGGRHRHPPWDRRPGRRGQVRPGRGQLRRPRR
jgi:hypothetical protein